MKGLTTSLSFRFWLIFGWSIFVVLIGWFWLFILARVWFLGTIAFQLRFLWRIFPFDTNPAPGGSRFAPSNWLTLRFYSYTLLLGLGFFWPLTSPRGQSDVQSVWTRDIGGPAPRVAIDWAVIYLYYNLNNLQVKEMMAYRVWISREFQERVPMSASTNWMEHVKFYSPLWLYSLTLNRSFDHWSWEKSGRTTLNNEVAYFPYWSIRLMSNRPKRVPVTCPGFFKMTLAVYRLMV